MYVKCISVDIDHARYVEFIKEKLLKPDVLNGSIEQLDLLPLRQIYLIV